MDNNKFFILLILLFKINICFSKFNVGEINIKQKNSSNVLDGTSLNYAYIDIELDDDLYKYDPLGCANYNGVCNSKIQVGDIDCSCDYTDFSECPKNRNPICTNVCPLIASDGETLMCGDKKWITITSSTSATTQTIFSSTLSTEPIYFRFKANAKICESLLVIVYPIVGFFRGSIGASPINQRKLPYEYVSTYNVMNLCPSDNQDYTRTESWTQDTYYVTIEPIAMDNITFSLQVHSENTPKSTLPLTPCTELLSTHTCMIDGEAITDEIQGPAFKYYSYQVVKDGYYIVNAPALYQDINIFISDNAQLTQPSINSPGKWQSADEYDDILIFYLQGTLSTPTNLYIGVYCSYPSNFTFSITSNVHYYPVRIIDLPSNAGAYAMTKSSRILFKDGSSFSCASWYLCAPYSVQFPLRDGNPLWPVSSYFTGSGISRASSSSYSSLVFQDAFLENPSKPSSFQSSFLLSSRVGSSDPFIFQTLSSVSQSTIQFLSSIFNSKGEPLQGDYPLDGKLTMQTCNYTSFQNVLEAIEKTQDILFGATDLIDLNNWRYRLEALTIRDDWIGCSVQASSLLNTDTVLANVSSSFCPYGFNDPRYSNEPCCNSSLTFFQCCNPKTVELPTTQFIGTYDDEINQQCSSFECTQSVLSEYYNSLSSVDDCTVSSFQLQSIKSSVIQTLKQCKQPEYSSSASTSNYCKTDQDCVGNSNNGKCDLFTRLCIPSFSEIDKRYIQCVLSNLAPGTLYGFLKVPSTIINSTLVDKIYNEYQDDDCKSESTTVGFRQALVYTSKRIPNGRCYPTEPCLDPSCQLEHDICFDQVYTGFQQYPFLDITKCNSIGFCPLPSQCDSIDYDSSDCSTQCNSVPSFCGHCSSDNTFCHEVSEITDSATCSSSSACLLPNGEYQLDVTQQDCETNYGICGNGNCGFGCVGGYTGCLIVDSFTEPTCTTHSAGSTWNSDLEICTSPSMDQLQCSSSGSQFVWVDCSSLSFDQCAGPNLDFAGLCSLSPIKCTTKDQCLSVGGECSDSYFFSSFNTENYPDGLGKCVRDHFSYRSGFYPSCNFENENDSPMGCFSHSPNHLSRASCEATEGNKWWIPSFNKTDCLSEYGCKTLDLNSDNLEYNFRFNQMSQQLCQGCYQSSNQWTNKFRWTDAQWLPGVYIPALQWKPSNKFTLIGVPGKTFSYQSFYSSLMNIVDTLVADLLRSETFCRMERLQSNLKSIACSCAGNGGSECFTASIPLIGQIKPCFGDSLSFKFDYGSLNFDKDSIQQGCPTLLISQYSKEIFTSTAPESLPSNFVSYQVPEKYGVLNSHGQIVGILLSDGIYIKSQFSSINKFQVCFIINNSDDDDNSKYPVYDFATLSNNQNLENIDEIELNPLSFETFIIQEDSTTNQPRLLCSNITSDTSFSNSSIKSYFPIVRISGNWRDEPKRVFDKSTRGLLYTLATFYLVVSVWGFTQIGMIIKNQLGQQQKFSLQLVHALPMIVTVFILIRSIYFFILPGGALSQNPSGDYILVILPTFIYFSTFTIIITLYYVIVFLVQKMNRTAQSLSKRVSVIIISINVVIYLLFVVCALVFTKTQPKLSNDCGSRIIIPMTGSIPQRAISISYAVIQTAISVILGTLFVYLGSSLYFVMSKTRKALGGGGSMNASHHNRIFWLTLICSIGFILHCIFILILVVGKSSIAFSFIGLIITEIIPSLTILYCYDPRHKLSSNRKQLQQSDNGNNMVVTGN